jgi:beta-glucanase (GH16 family)
MKSRLVRSIGVILAIATLATPAFAQAKNTVAPDQIPGIAVYIPYPVAITIDGKTEDWKNIPSQRVETGYPPSPDKKQNAFFDFSVASDGKSLFVYMYSEDSNIISGKHEQNFWNEDSLEFYVNLTKNLAAKTYAPGIMQICVNATNIGKKAGTTPSISGVSSQSAKVQLVAFKEKNGWAFEAALALPSGFTAEHGKIIGFQAAANGATVKDRDSKLIWGKADVSDQSYQNPSLFGQGIFFKTGSTATPEPANLANDLASTFKNAGAVGKKDRTLAWSDEFDYEGEPAPAKWGYDAADSGKYNQELQIYTNSRANSFVKNGKLTIAALKNSAGAWSSARLITNGKATWTYGYMEVSAKLPAGKGVWPAIWMMPATDVYGSWPASGEIDLMEFVGFEPEKIHTSAHTMNYNHRKGTQPTRSAIVKGVSDGFHTYAVEWTPKAIFWYVDDKPFYSFENTGKGSAEWPFDKPFYMILNVAIGGSWGGMQGVDENMKSAEMQVDYVRVYR